MLIADEAVSMIDVSLRLGILRLLSDLRSRLGISIIFITHDVAAARYVAQDGMLLVLYRGTVVESGPTDDIIESPVHPYTQALLSAMPVLRGLEHPGPDRYIPKQELDVNADDHGCLFRDRCPFATEQCQSNTPRLVSQDETDVHQHACFYPEPRRVVPMVVDS